MEIGDIQTDPDGSEWVIISVGGAFKPSRVRRNSLAHHIHAKSDSKIAVSLQEEVDGSATTSENRPDTAR